MLFFSLPCLSDNYAHGWHDPETGFTAVVDPSEAAPVRSYLDEKQWTLSTVLLTHHHWDHVGGVETLKSHYHCEVVGFANDSSRLPPLDTPIEDGQTFKLGEITVRAIFVPGHTLGHVAYYVESQRAVFSGDTLFSLGCGRLFEGTPAQMYSSLKKLAALPDDTQVFCGHEYTLGHCQFAESLFPEDKELLRYCDDQRARFERSHCTLPSLIKDEKRFNPFLRTQSETEFAQVRKTKDNWRP